MASVNLKALVDKLNTRCKKALENAAGLCVSRTNYEVEIEHCLLKLLETDGDVARVFKHYDIDRGKVSQELTRAIDKFRRGMAREGLSFSPKVVDWLNEAWGLTSLQFGASQMRSGYLLAGLMADRDLADSIRASSPELNKLNGEQLVKEIKTILKGSPEDAGEPAAGPPSMEAEVSQPATGSKTPALDQFTLNLTERARKGEIDPVIGRDFEIRQVIDILTRRRQNNPILTGEAGVGKTAVVEGFALAVIAGEVPPPLRGVAVRTLDLGLLQAGAGVKGEFENRLKQVIAEVKASAQPIILFIDEAHTLIGAGGTAGQGDAANLLKPALARGELRTIAATTWMEYKKYFETDPALKRRFQVVKVDEPDIIKAARMMRGFAKTLEKHHNVRVLDEAIEDAVKLSHRYITDRQLPDKSVTLLDTACAKVALSQSALPAALQDCQRELESIDVEIGILEREVLVGRDHDLRMADLQERKKAALKKQVELKKRWEEEKRLAAEVQRLQARLEASAAERKQQAPRDERGGADEQRQTREELARVEKELATLQGENPLVLPVVGSQAVAEIVAGWTGIPVGKMVRNEIIAVQTLDQRLKERVIGQDHALQSISERIRTARAGLADPRRPIGVFLLVGPSGVGKTETAMALADILYGGDRNMTVINMSEYKEEHKVSRLTGSAPGYVGYGEGGVLTEAVRRKPYSVVLLDEVEKANESVQEIFYQVFDKGVLQDDKGTDINFKNTIILLTSNVGTDTIMKVCADPDTRPDARGLGEALRPDLLKAFKPALLGRMTVVPYFPLDDAVLRGIIQLQLKRIADRVRENHRAAFSYADNVITTIANRCKEVESGARNVDHIINGTLLPAIAAEFLACMAEGRPVTKAHVNVGTEGEFVYDVH